jgi:hypothetical protein
VHGEHDAGFPVTDAEAAAAGEDLDSVRIRDLISRQ